MIQILHVNPSKILPYCLQLLAMLNGADGKIIWQRLPEQASYDLYNVLIIHDVNFDGYMDILAARYRPNAGNSILLIVIIRSSNSTQNHNT